jgi:hypothetical protein
MTRKIKNILTNKNDKNYLYISKEMLEKLSSWVLIIETERGYELVPAEGFLLEGKQWSEPQIVDS